MQKNRWLRRLVAGTSAGLMAASFAVTVGVSGASAATMSETKSFTANAPFVSNNIDVKRTVSHNELRAGDEFTVTYELQNTGKNGGFTTGGTDWYQHYFEDAPPASVEFLGMDAAATSVYRGRKSGLNDPTAWDGAPADPSGTAGTVLIDWRHKNGTLSGSTCTAVGTACALGMLSNNGSTPTTLTLRYQVKSETAPGQLTGWTSKSQLEVEGTNTLTWSGASLPTVLGAAPTTTGLVTAAPNPVAVDTATRLSASVTGIPVGSAVDFVAAGTPSTVLCTGAVIGQSAGCDWTPNAVGNVDVIATYAGTSASAPSSSPTATAVEVVKAQVTLGQVSANPNPATVGQQVTLGVDVTGGQQGIDVQFRDGAVVLCSAPTDASGHAKCNGWSPQSVADVQVIAHYAGGSGTDAAASAPISVVVRSAAVTVSDVTATPNPATVGQPVTLTTKVLGGEMGTAVQFRDGETVLCEANVDGDGRAQCPWSPATTGTARILAHYAGGQATDPGSSQHAVTVQVSAVPSTVTSTSPVSVSGIPAVGSTLTLSAVVTNAAAGVDVQFRNSQEAVLCAAQTDSAGKASCEWPLTADGTTAITAHYAGDGATAPSQSPTATTVAVGNSPQPGAPSIGVSPINPLVGDTARVTVRVPGGSEGAAVSMAVDGAGVCADLALRADGTAECAWEPVTPGLHTLTFTVGEGAGAISVEQAVLVAPKDGPADPGGDAGAGSLASLATNPLFGSLGGIFGTS